MARTGEQSGDAEGKRRHYWGALACCAVWFVLLLLNGRIGIPGVLAVIAIVSLIIDLRIRKHVKMRQDAFSSHARKNRTRDKRLPTRRAVIEKPSITASADSAHRLLK